VNLLYKFPVNLSTGYPSIHFPNHLSYCMLSQCLGP